MDPVKSRQDAVQAAVAWSQTELDQRSPASRASQVDEFGEDADPDLPQLARVREALRLGSDR